MPLREMLETRHKMSQTVRAEVSEKARLTLFVDGAKERLLADLLAADEPHGTASAPSVTD